MSVLTNRVGLITMPVLKQAQLSNLNMYITSLIAHKRRQLFTTCLKLKASYKNWVAEHLEDNLNRYSKRAAVVGFARGL